MPGVHLFVPDTMHTFKPIPQAPQEAREPAQNPGAMNHEGRRREETAGGGFNINQWIPRFVTSTAIPQQKGSTGGLCEFFGATIFKSSRNCSSD
jgi:hypothetical protein